MDIVAIKGGVAHVKLTVAELVLLSNALLETREVLEDWEFETQTCATSVQAEKLRQQIAAALDGTAAVA